MTTVLAAPPTSHFRAQACDDYCQHPCGCKFHVREGRPSNAEQWTPGIVYQHCEDWSAAQDAAVSLNKAAV